MKVNKSKQVIEESDDGEESWTGAEEGKGKKKS